MTPDPMFPRDPAYAAAVAAGKRRLEREWLEATGCVQQRRARSTRTLVGIYRPGAQDDEPGWTLICEPHGGVLKTATRAQAARFAPAPEEWCPTCQEEAAMTDRYVVAAAVGGWAVNDSQQDDARVEYVSAWEAGGWRLAAKAAQDFADRLNSGEVSR